MDKKFAKNYLYNMAYELLALIVPLITAPYVSRVLGATAIGDYGFTSGIVSYFGLISALGTITYAKREIAFCQTNLFERSKVFSEILIFRLVITSVVAISYILFLCLTTSSLRTLYIIQLLTVASWLVDFSWLFQGMEDFRITAVRNSAVKVVGAILIFIFVRNRDDLYIYVFILCSSMLLGNLTTIPYLKKYLIRVPLSELKIKRHIPGVMMMFASVVAVHVYTVLDQTMLGILINTTEVGYYIQAQKIINVTLTVISSYATILLPRIAVLFKTNNIVDMKKTICLSLDYLFVLALPLMAGVFLCANDFVPVYFGDGYEPTIDILRIFSVLFVITGAGQLAGSFLTAVDKQMVCVIAVFSGAGINVVLNSFLIRAFSGKGACIASVIAEMTASTITIYAINKMFSLSYGLRAFLHYMIPTIIMSVFIFIIQNIMIEGTGRLILEVSTGIVVYVMTLLLMKDKLIRMVFNRKKT